MAILNPGPRGYLCTMDVNGSDTLAHPGTFTTDDAA
jgi:hypothetical protein